MNRIKNNYIFIFYLIIYAFLLIKIYLYKDSILEGWDESIYAQLGVEFTKKIDFILYYNGEAWLEKPFLIGWITGIIHYFSAYNIILMRSFFALIGTINLYFIWKITKNMLNYSTESHKDFVSLLSPIFILTTYLFLERSTTVNTDIILVFGLLGYYLYKEKFLVRLVFLCIAVWSKSLLGFLPLILDIILNFKESIYKKSMLKIFTLFFVPSLWYIYGYFRFGNQFVQKHFIEQIFSRSSTVLESHSGKWWFYLDYFIKTSPVATALLAVTLIYALITQFKSNMKINFDLRKASPILAGLVFLILISVSQSKLEWYLLPTIFLVSPIISITWGNANKYTVLILATVFGLLGISAILVTPLYSRNSPDNIELTKVAKCISSQPQKNTILYQNTQNIKEYTSINNSGGSISSTFRYGGNPAFIYYSKKEKVEFIYNNSSNVFDKNTVVVTPNDRKLDISKLDLITGCSTQNYRIYTAN
ncbi:MAG: hypothetical protein H7196_04300 [candidate division SR1 bacterium]|nr:hypothetical protein [candidate division SR1 bacterium]